LPELPEVETIRRDLVRHVVGRRFTAVEVMPGAEKVVALPSLAEFQRALPGLRIEGIERRGKYLLFPLSDGRYLIVHLRMTGALIHRRVGAPADNYLRVRLALDIMPRSLEMKVPLKVDTKVGKNWGEME